MDPIMEADYYYLSFFCHQITTRSPEFGDMPFPVCFRCAGIYLGIICGYMFIALEGKSLFNADKALILVIFIIPVLVDGIGNKFGIWNSSAGWRVLTGLSMGFVFPQLLSIIKSDPFCPKKLFINYPKLPFLFSLGLGVIFYYLILNVKGILIFYGLVIIVTTGNLAFILDLLKSRPFLIRKKLMLRHIHEKS